MFQGRSKTVICFTFLFIACLLLCGVADAASSITLSKKSGPPTSRILVSGRGFEPNVGVDIYFDTKDEMLVVTNGEGEFDHARIYAPRAARPGQHWVTALERNSDKGAQRPFLVQTNWSEFHFDADGTRLNPYENALNPNTVESLALKWTYATGGYVWSSPAVANGVVYVGSYDGNIYALDARTGVKLWSYQTDSHEDFSSLTVGNEVVYVSTDHVYALNAKTGALLWSYATGGFVLSSPALANGVVYVGSDDYNVYALNAKTGAKLWSYATGSYVDSSPTVANGVVYVGSRDYNVYGLNASTGAKLWSYKTANEVYSSPAVANGVVYVGSNDYNVYGLNASTGAKLWSYTARGGVYSSPAVANGVVYVGSGDGNVYALNAHTGTLLWSYATNGQVDASPAVANGVVYINSYDGNLYALKARTGAKLWSYHTGDWVSSSLTSPAVVNGRVYVGSVNAHVYAFGLK